LRLVEGGAVEKGGAGDGSAPRTGARELADGTPLGRALDRVILRLPLAADGHVTEPEPSHQHCKNPEHCVRPPLCGGSQAKSGTRRFLSKTADVRGWAVMILVSGFQNR